MSVARPLLQRAHSAILASISRDELRRILAFSFGQDFDTLVAQTAYADQVFELLRRSERSGNLLPLLRCLVTERPNSQELAAVAAEVLAAYAEMPPAPDPDWGLTGVLAPAQLTRYEAQYLLQVRNECRYIRTEGVGEPDVELTDVFVMLRAIENPGASHRFDTAKRSDVVPTSDRQTEMGLPTINPLSGNVDLPQQESPPPLLPLAQAMRDHLHIAILGEPGSGKSTTLQYLALCFSTENAPFNRLEIDETRIPVFLELRTYDGGRPFADHLIQIIARLGLFHVTDNVESERIARSLLEHWLQEKRVIILLDALDEVQESQRVSVLREIERFAGTSEGNECRIVLSSRIAAYRSVQRPGSSFDPFMIHPFRNEADALPYVAGWLRVLASERLTPEASMEQAQVLLDQMTQQQGLRRIFSNPLLLRLAVAAYLETGEPIHNRAEIYRRYVDEVLWQRSQRYNVARFPKAQVQQALACVAWILQSQPQTPVQHIVERLNTSRDVEFDSDAMLVFLQQGLGLLGAYDYANGTLLAFRHLTFQEFLVGRLLAKLWTTERQTTWRLLQAQLHVPAWRESIMLMAGLLEQSAATEFVKQVRTAKSRFERELHRDLMLAIDLLADSGHLDAELVRSIATDVRALATDSSVASLTLSVWPGYRKFWGPGISTLNQNAQLIRSLGRLGAPSVTYLAFHLSRSNYLWRQAAAEGLGETGTITAIPYLTKALKDSEKPVREAANDAMAKLGDPGLPYPGMASSYSHKAVDIIVSEQLRNDNTVAVPHSNETATVVVIDTDDLERETANELPGALDDPVLLQFFGYLLTVGSFRSAAAEALEGLDDVAAVDYYVGALSDSDYVVRATAAENLGELGAGTAVPHLMNLLSDPVDIVRWAAATALGDIHDVTACPILAIALSDPSDSVRKAAAIALSKMGDAAAAPNLIRAMAGPDRDARKSAAAALDNLGEAASPHIVSALSDPDYNLRRVAAVLLGKFGYDAIPYLVKALSDSHLFVSSAAAAALCRQGSAAIPYLIESLADSDGSTRWMAVDVLSQIAHITAIPHLVQALKDPVDYVRLRAAVALHKMRNTAIPYLIQGLRDSNDCVRRQSAWMLGEIGSVAATPRLIEAVGDSDASVRREATTALGKLGDATALPLFIESLRDSDGAVRREAAKALGRLGDPTSVPYLIEALSDSDDSVRRAVMTALGKMGDSAAVPYLMDALSELDNSISWAAAESLAELLSSKIQYDAALLEKWAADLTVLAYSQRDNVRSNALTLLGAVVSMINARSVVRHPLGAYAVCA